ncbi:DUF6213 family protein [Streptantibioticus cattleyicolor]|uniref:Uncharacterized protein n=1 Tax=Streptantibioticus cattleyicolor (strain ATCC 35852 / DSM 46488 / JCM 4925 / NBRC 14057 / NRRL 8057) TaxID=1003195 RepID=F8JK81_STREN|nr:DUF6213 family protein [Streptantibioticus cattleyicolor]AEW98558.1 hypothetical protein SCATT_p03650 [Streptantibioticus cattleyicolor NRRL 8057 = DSM 46488]CCB72384.1 conserved protein of unknown function [Streptantibioticus cattleyicolor NRRL 8057 = DSM 46488]
MGAQGQIPMAWHDGQLHMPAADVARLLRSIAALWSEWTAAGEPELDRQTADTLAGTLTDVADQLDLACIAEVTDARLGPGAQGGAGADPGTG